MPELELTTEADLLDVLKKILPTVDERTEKTPEQRSLALQIFGTNRNRFTLDAVDAHLDLLQTAADVDQFKALQQASPLPADEQSVLARHGFDSVTRFADAAALNRGPVTGVRDAIGSVRASISQALSELEADRASLQARLDKADAASAPRQAPVREALAALTKLISREGMHDLQFDVERAADRLAKAEAALLAASGDAAIKNAAAKVARRKARVLEVDPDRMIAQRIQDVVDKLPLHSDERSLLGGVAREVRLAALNREAETRRQALVADLPELGRAGGSIKRRISISADAEWGTLGKLTKISAGGSYGFSVEMRRLSNGKFQARVANAVAVSGAATVGDRDATHAALSAAIEASASEWRTYNSLEDLAVAEGDYLMTLAVGRGRSDAKAARKYLKDRRDALQQTVAGRSELTEDLARLITTTPKESKALSVKGQDIEQIERVRTQRRAGAVSVDASLQIKKLDFTTDDSSLPGGLSLEGGLAFSHVRSQDFASVSYLDGLLKNADTQAIEAMKHPAAMRRFDANGVPESAAATQHYYDSLRSDLATLKSLASDGLESREVASGLVGQQEVRSLVRARQRELGSDMERLAAEYDLFVELHNRRTNGDLDPGGHGEATYKRLLADRGISDTRIGASNKAARYIKAVSLQFAVLRDLRETSENIVASSDDKLVQFQKRFEAALRMPRITLTEKQRRSAFGDEAATDVTTVNTTSITVAAAYGDGLAKGGKPTDPKVAETLGQFSGVSAEFVGTYTKATSKTPGKPPSTSVVMEVDFSLGSLGGDVHRGAEVDDNFTSKLAGSMAAKLLDRRGLRNLFGSDPGGHEAAVSELTGAIAAVATKAGGRLQVRFALVDGKMRLKNVAAVESSQTAFAVGGVFPVAPSLNLAVKMAETQTKTTRLAVYHGSNTLSALTDAHRIRRPTIDADGSEWDKFTKDSNLLQRLVETLGKNAAKSATEGGDDLVAVLAKVKAGTLDENQLKSWRLKPDSVANELVPWLLALKAGKAADVTAADAFIDGYTARRVQLEDRRTSSARRSQALDEMAGLLDSVVARKRVNEDDAEEKRFVPQRRLSRSEVNGHIAARLSEKFSELDLRVERKLNPAGTEDRTGGFLSSPDSLQRMKRRVLQAYETAPDDETFALVRDVLSLEFAAESLDDLTQYGNARDMERALARTAKGVDNVFSDQKVYLGGMIEGRLQRGRDGTLEVRPVVPPDRAGLLRHSQIRRDLDRARDRNSESPHKLRFEREVTIELGDSERKWTSSDKDVEAREAYYRTRRVKGRFATKGRAARKKKKRSSKSIGALLEKLLNANAERQQQKRRLERQRRARREALEDA